nr:hypothetical protein [Tanacetum cinerariifolium]
SYETPSSSSSSLTLLPTLSTRKRYQGTSELIVDTKTKSDESEDKGTDSKSEEAALEDQQQQAVSAEDIAKDESLGLGYKAARRRALERAEDIVPSTFKNPPSPVETPVLPDWFPESLPVSSIVPSPAAIVGPTTALDESDLLEIRNPPSPVETPVLPDWFPESLPVSSIVPSPAA